MNSCLESVLGGKDISGDGLRRKKIKGLVAIWALEMVCIGHH